MRVSVYSIKLLRNISETTAVFLYNFFFFNIEEATTYKLTLFVM